LAGIAGRDIMAKIFYVDLPDPKYDSESGDSEWVNVKTTHTKEEAEQFLFDAYGIEKDHADLFITEGDDYE